MDQGKPVIIEDLLADDDMRLYPEFVEQWDTLDLDAEEERIADEEQMPEEQIPDEEPVPAQFDDTDEEEMEENSSMGADQHSGVESSAVIQYDKDNPCLDQGQKFPSMNACRNALATFCIKNEYDYVIDKSEPARLSVHCSYSRCQWRLHASTMRNSTIVQVKVNPCDHTCPSGLRRDVQKLATSSWCAEAMLEWVTENPCIGTTALTKKLEDKWHITVPYMRVFYGREMALDMVLGPWKESFKLLYTFKAEVEKVCPGSVVEIDKQTVEYKMSGRIIKKECFRRVFVSFKACWQGFRNGCRPYLAVDATALHGRYRGQLVAACGIDAHNWLFPVAYGVLETESTTSWTWFLQQLRTVVGFPHGLVIHTDASKGLENAVEAVFPGVEHRECMRHLSTNFGKKHKGKIFDDNLWPASLTYSIKKHKYHLDQIYSRPHVKAWMEKNHPKIWARSKFNEVCKVDYVTNNLAESFNSWVKKVKGLHLVELLDKIRQMIMAKFTLRQTIAAEKFVGHQIIPHVMKVLHAKTRNLRMTMVKRTPSEAEVTEIDNEKREWRYTVNLVKRSCGCRQWQISGLPCTHALFFITSLRGPAAEIDNYVHESYSVAKFNATYAENVPSIEAKHQWDIVNPGFVLHAPPQSRAPGRPRKVRIRSSVEGGRSGLGPRKRKCKRCGGTGHIARTCKNAVDPSFGEDVQSQADNSILEYQDSITVPESESQTKEKSPPNSKRKGNQRARGIQPVETEQSEMVPPKRKRAMPLNVDTQPSDKIPAKRKRATPTPVQTAVNKKKKKGVGKDMPLNVDTQPSDKIPAKRKRATPTPVQNSVNKKKKKEVGKDMPLTGDSPAKNTRSKQGKTSGPAKNTRTKKRLLVDL